MLPSCSVGVHGLRGGWFPGWGYAAALCCAATLCAWRLLSVPVPAIPDAAYLASISVGTRGFGIIGVSGGGGDPRCALVVEVDAVELILFTDEGSLTLSLPPADSPGGGQYCWL